MCELSLHRIHTQPYTWLCISKCCNPSKKQKQNQSRDAFFIPVFLPRKVQEVWIILTCTDVYQKHSVSPFQEATTI